MTNLFLYFWIVLGWSVAAIYILLYYRIIESPYIYRPNQYNERIVVRHTDRYGLLAGFRSDVVSTSLLYSKTGWEYELINKVAPFIKSFTTVLDIGANIGASSLELNRACGLPNVEYVMVEMQVDVLPVLKFNTRTLTNRKIYGAAIAARNGAISYDDSEKSGNIGKTKTSVSALTNDFLYTGVITLADIQSTYPVSVMKVDIEGQEHALFDSEDNLAWWKKVRPSVVLIECFKKNRHKVFLALRKLGYVHQWSSSDDHLFRYTPLGE